MTDLKAPFPYIGGKRSVIDLVWQRFGSPKQYIEPFCGSAAMLLGAPKVASLEVINDVNGFIANFWRCTKHQPIETANWADYPVSHIDLGARHAWLMLQRDRLGAELRDPNWPGDPQVAGWWLWGQCAWIGSRWCEWDGKTPRVDEAIEGINEVGKIPHASDAGQGVQETLTSSGFVARVWLAKLAARLERVRVTHGSWDRCLNHHFGAENTAVFLDPPYLAFEGLYGTDSKAVAVQVAEWARDNAGLRIALCGHIGDYDMPGWSVKQWDRNRTTYGSDKTSALEAIWFSPACLPETGQLGLFDAVADAGGAQ